jgi:hypothetical protein
MPGRVSPYPICAVVTVPLARFIANDPPLTTLILEHQIVELGLELLLSQVARFKLSLESCIFGFNLREIHD